MNKLPPGSPGDLQRRLFQISETLSLEERNLRNNPSEKIKGTASAVPFSLPASDHATDLFQDHDADLYENASQDGVHLNHLLSE
jgi:hypothetical protein